MIPTKTDNGLHELVGNNVLTEFVCLGLRIAAFSAEHIPGDAQILALGAAK
jgi:hypothetical protein